MSFSFDKLPVDKFFQKNLSFNEGNVLSAIRGGGVLGLINSVLAPSFGIYYASGKDQGKQPFTPDSFVVVEVGAEASVSTAPVEQGAYTTFNKIQRPPELHVTFTVEGWTAFSGAVPNLTNFSTTSRSNVLEILEKMRTTAGLYDIETPDKTWTSCDLVKYDYRTRSNNGPTLLTVTAVFQTILKTGEVSVGSTDKKAPTDNDKVKGEASVKTQQVTASVSQPPDAEAGRARAAVSGDINLSDISQLGDAAQKITGRNG
ncbi:TPA: phage baseplate protein [Salmonella enterica subsp. enterica serovar Montevideo]